MTKNHPDHKYSVTFITKAGTRIFSQKVHSNNDDHDHTIYNQIHRLPQAKVYKNDKKFLKKSLFQIKTSPEPKSLLSTIL